MNRMMVAAALAAAAVAGAGGAAGVRLRRAAATRAGRDRWHTVTVCRAPGQLGPMPRPLDELGFPVEVRLRAAPGSRGTELAARLAGPAMGPTADPAGPAGPAADRAAGRSGGRGGPVARLRGDDPVQTLRRSLREAKALAEVGEVLLPDSPGTARRTLTGAPLALAARRGRTEGRL